MACTDCAIHPWQWIFGVPLTVLLLMHTFHCLTASTTYEFVKLEKLEYLNGFYQFSFPFSDGLLANIRHLYAPRECQPSQTPLV